MSEDLDHRLLNVLRRVSGMPGLEYAEPPSPLTGGFWAELATFRLRGAGSPWDRWLVARVMPDAVLAGKEIVIQRTVADAEFPTPRVHASGGPADGLGRAFMVMDRADGAPLLAGLQPRAILRLPRLARRIPEVLASSMAQLHRLDPAVVRRELIGTSASVTVEDMVRGIERAAGAFGRADLGDAARWLMAHRPADDPAVICHGDLHPFNVLVDAAGGVTVLDWSASLLAPRAYDVAFTSLLLSEPPIVVPHALQPLARRAGGWLSRRFVGRYEHHSGTTIDETSLEWHQVVVCLRALTEVASWVDAGELDGRSRHPWVVGGDAFATKSSALTGVTVRPR